MVIKLLTRGHFNLVIIVSPATAMTLPCRGDRERRHLKPLFEVGTAVTAAWWPDQRSQYQDLPSSWRSGIVRSRRRTSVGGTYGPTWSYGVEYLSVDGSAGNKLDVAKHLLFTSEDYDLSMKNDGKGGWIGVKNVVDKTSNDLWGERFKKLKH